MCDLMDASHSQGLFGRPTDVGCRAHSREGSFFQSSYNGVWLMEN
jgi:hypothetical protein